MITVGDGNHFTKITITKTDVHSKMGINHWLLDKRNPETVTAKLTLNTLALYISCENLNDFNPS